ncbi:hypothetical protein B0J15DRAFT_400874, partial [Fusarium solani]
MGRLGTYVDRQIALDKAINYLGTASIHFRHLAFPECPLDRANVDRTKALMQYGRACLPEKSSHQICAIVDRTQLKQALLRAGVLENQLLNYSGEYVDVDFPDNYRLQCLQGKHRVAAAAEILPFSSRRWIVKLFSSEIQDKTKCDLEEERSNEKDIEDGEFYYRIRLYDGSYDKRFGSSHQDTRRARKWWALLEGTKCAVDRSVKPTKGTSGDYGRLKQLFNYTHSRYTDAFDSFYCIPALYSGFKNSAIQKMLSMDNIDENISSLTFIREFWESVFEGDRKAMRQFDADSLRLLDCKAPGAVESDRLELQGLIASRRIFGNFDEARRDRLWQRICVLTTDCLTPTLWGFFHNLKQLQLISTCLTSLVEVKDHSLRQTLQDQFQASRPDQFLIQVSPLQYRSIHAPGIDVDNFSIAYRQLWLYAWRHHEEMQPSPEKKLAGAQIKPANEIVMLGLANLASRLGFESDTINHLRERDPYRTMAHRHLRDLKQPGSRRSAKHEACVQSMIDCYVSAWEPANEGGTVGSEDEALSQTPTRCGLPRLRDHDKDKGWLFIHYMHNESVDEVFEISSLFAIRSLYKQIFHNMAPVSVDLDTSTAEIDCSSGLEHFYNQREVRPVTSKTPTEDGTEIDAYQIKVQESSQTIDELEKCIHERRRQYQQEETNLNNVKEQLRQAREQLSQANDTHLDTGRVNDLEAQNNQYKQEV